MYSKRKFLKKSKKYYFRVFHGIDINTIEKIRYSYLGIKAIKLFTKEYEQLPLTLQKSQILPSNQ